MPETDDIYDVDKLWAKIEYPLCSFCNSHHVDLNFIERVHNIITDEFESIFVWRCERCKKTFKTLDGKEYKNPDKTIKHFHLIKLLFNSGD